MQCDHADLFGRVHSGFLFFPLRTVLMYTGALDLPFTSVLQCDLLAATHSLSMYDARVMHTVLMQCVNSGM